MKITLDIPAERIANMMISAMESGDPVTTAARGGWCDGIFYMSKKTPAPGGKTVWYATPELYEHPNFQIEIHEVDDEDTGHITVHTVRREQLIKGLETMATVFPHAFAQILEDDTDAPCADALLQSILFGDEKYA